MLPTIMTANSITSSSTAHVAGSSMRRRNGSATAAPSTPPLPPQVFQRAEADCGTRQVRGPGEGDREQAQPEGDPAASLRGGHARQRNADPDQQDRHHITENAQQHRQGALQQTTYDARPVPQQPQGTDHRQRKQRQGHELARPPRQRVGAQLAKTRCGPPTTMPRLPCPSPSHSTRSIQLPPLAARLLTSARVPMAVSHDRLSTRRRVPARRSPLLQRQRPAVLAGPLGEQRFSLVPGRRGPRARRLRRCAGCAASGSRPARTWPP